MKFINRDIGLEILLDDDLPEKLYEHAMKHYPNEFGGLLVGSYTNNNKMVEIVDTILPKSFKSSRYTFDRGTAGLKKALKAVFSSSGSLVYVGEWHTHPDAASIPSGTDLAAMREIADHNSVLILNPILLILSLSKDRFDFAFYVYYNNKLLKYESV